MLNRYVLFGSRLLSVAYLRGRQGGSKAVQAQYGPEAVRLSKKAQIRRSGWPVVLADFR